MGTPANEFQEAIVFDVNVLSVSLVAVKMEGERQVESEVKVEVKVKGAVDIEFKTKN